MVGSAPMRFASALVATFGLLVAVPATALAQDEGSTETEAAETTETADTAETTDDAAAAAEGDAAVEEAPRNVSASGYATTEQPFSARRGWFAEGELGVFMTIGGRNSDKQLEGFPSVGISNASPYIAVILGYDVFSTDSFALSVGPKFGAAFNSGSSRVTSDFAQQRPQAASTFANDYAAYEAGLNVSLVFMVAEQLSVTAKLNGGAVFVDSNPNVDYCGVGGVDEQASPSLPTDADTLRELCGDTDAGNLAIGGLFGASAGIEWYTLLNGFSVGVQIRFQGLLVDGFIPGIAIPATLRYTF